VRIHMVIHESFEAPGAFETWARIRGHAIGYSRLHAGEVLPRSADGFDLLVILGGPQSPSTTIRECPHFDAEAEKALITRAIGAGRAVVGVCLGAQLLGEALGANCEGSPHKEIGKFPITLTDAGTASDRISHFGRSLGVGHWHSDMPGLTDRARVLAYSDGCPRQIIEYGDLVYGFQCHMEFTPELIELMVAASAGELASLAGQMFVQQPAALRQNDYEDMNAKLFVFLDKLMLAYWNRCGEDCR
jgi:GMP synthase (glutamine-hydrolysing)